MKLSSLSILIPAYRDAKTIATVIKRAVLAGRRYANTFEIIVLNDASPDNLSSVLARVKKTIPMLRILTHKKNVGYGQTIKELYLLGIHEWLFTVPGDNQMDPMELSNLVPFANGADMIIGRRIHRQDNKNRKRQSALYNGLLRFLFGITIRDMNSIRLMKRKIMKNRVIHATSAFVDAQLTIGAIRDGFTVIEKSIVHKKRMTTGASGGKLKIILPVIIDMVRYFFQL